MSDDAAHFEATPTVRPTAALAALVAVLGVVLYVLASNHDSQTVQETGPQVVALLSGLALFVLAVRVALLRRTTYRVRADAVEREYRLLGAYRSHQLPLSQIRGEEVTHDRIQNLFGYGSVRFISSGGGQYGLGHLSFDHVDSPEQVRATVRDLRAD